MSQYEKFLQLHKADSPLLIGNAWDVTSAKIIEQKGLKAIATSSRAIALSMGYDDGENIPFDLLLLITKRMIASVQVPLSVDMERGYGNNVQEMIESIEKMYDVGVVGFNIEDRSKEKREMRPVAEFQKIISAIMNHLEQKNRKMYLNARTDGYLLQLPNALEESLARAKAYEEAGASGIFVPLVKEKNEITKIAETTSLPLNVISTKGLPAIPELAALGVKRISMGSSLYESFKRSIEGVLELMIARKSVAPLYSFGH